MNDVRDKKAWLLTATLENWKIAENKGVFGCHGNRSFLKRIRKGDYYTAFVPKIGFIGDGIVSGGYYVGTIKLWEDKAYNHRFQISTPVISGRVLPATSIIDDLGFVTNKKRWGVFFRSGIREIPLDDYSIISQRLAKSAPVLHEISKNIEKGDTTRDIGDELHNRVLELFKNLGFNILENNYSMAGPDITVVDPEDINENKIIIQCKNSKQAGSTFDHLDKHLNEYSGRLHSGGAKAAILVIAGQKLPPKVPGETGELDIDRILQKYNVAVWTEETLDYYEELVEKISRFARYQVLSDLGMKLSFSEDIEVETVKIVQNGFVMYAVPLSPDWLLRTVSVARRIRAADGPKGYQRLLDKNRIVNSNKSASISNYIDSNPDWLFPNAIVLASSRSSNLVHDKRNLHLKSSYGQFWVIDGQHRLFAFANADSRKKDNKLLCVIIDTKSFGTKQNEESELAQIFVTLNGRGKKVSKALLYELYHVLGSDDHPQLEIILRLADEEFFAGCIRGYSDKGGSINLVSFADAKGTDSIYKYFKNKYENKTDKEVITKTAEYILNSFKEIAKVFDAEWSNSDDYFLKTDRGVRGMLGLLSKVLEKYGSNREDLIKVIQALKDARFDFSSETAKGLYLGAGGPEKLVQAFARHINRYIFDFAPNSSRYEVQSRVARLGDIEEDFLREWMGKLEGDIRCTMMFIDKSTINKYLNYLNFEKIKRVRMFFGKCDPKDEKQVKEGLALLRGKELDITLTQFQKKTPHGGSVFHARWIGDDKMQIDTSADLKDKSQQNSEFYIKVYRWENPPELDDFERYWGAAETNEEVEFGYDWGSQDD